MNSYQVAVAAESLVALLLSQAGYDVFVQYGTNQPGYDLVAVKPGRTLKVSVKGTQEAGWIFSAGFLTKGQGGGDKYHKAADAWLEKHGSNLVFAYVQFRGIPIGQMPEVYVVRAHEVAAHVKAGKRGGGDTTLRWKHTWKSGVAKGYTDTVPETWKFAQHRIDSI
jgi:Holliday junction resolvase-like predicted endonuclease